MGTYSGDVVFDIFQFMLLLSALLPVSYYGMVRSCWVSAFVLHNLSTDDISRRSGDAQAWLAFCTSILLHHVHSGHVCALVLELWFTRNARNHLTHAVRFMSSYCGFMDVSTKRVSLSKADTYLTKTSQKVSASLHPSRQSALRILPEPTSVSKDFDEVHRHWVSRFCSRDPRQAF